MIACSIMAFTQGRSKKVIRQFGDAHNSQNTFPTLLFERSYIQVSVNLCLEASAPANRLLNTPVQCSTGDISKGQSYDSLSQHCLSTLYAHNFVLLQGSVTSTRHLLSSALVGCTSIGSVNEWTFPDHGIAPSISEDDTFDEDQLRSLRYGTRNLVRLQSWT